MNGQLYICPDMNLFNETLNKLCHRKVKSTQNTCNLKQFNNHPLIESAFNESSLIRIQSLSASLIVWRSTGHPTLPEPQFSRRTERSAGSSDSRDRTAEKFFRLAAPKCSLRGSRAAAPRGPANFAKLPRCPSRHGRLASDKPLRGKCATQGDARGLAAGQADLPN